MPTFPADFASSTLASMGEIITYLSTPLTLILGILLGIAVIAIIIKIFVHH